MDTGIVGPGPTDAVSLEWSSWESLVEALSTKVIPTLPGLYRIRREGTDVVDYIGQTGKGRMNVRSRLQMLSGAYKDEMPYTDPHIVAPALWALRHSTGCDFEVSVVPIEGSDQWRKGLEAVAIALYRQERGTSPTLNFGRMPAGYLKSSANNRRLVEAGKRFRGGASELETAHHAAGIPPVGPLSGHIFSHDWCRHEWSPWVDGYKAITEVPLGHNGLYRVRVDGDEELTYIGEGALQSRLNVRVEAILRRAVSDGLDLSKQPPTLISWVANDSWRSLQRLELENDLIAAHVLSASRPPAMQFMGAHR